MALISEATYLVSITLVDRDANKRTMQVRYPSDNTIGNVLTEVTGTLIPAIQGISNALIAGHTISLATVDNDIAPLVDAPEASDVERKAVYVFRNSVGTTTKYEIPSVKNELVVDGTNVLNPTDAAVVAFLNAITTAGVDGLAATDSAGGELGKLASPPRKIHRASSKG